MPQPKTVFLPQISLGNVLTILGGLVAIGTFLVSVGSWKSEQELTNKIQSATISDIQTDQKAAMRKLNSLETRLIVIDEKLTGVLAIKKAEYP